MALLRAAFNSYLGFPERNKGTHDEGPLFLDGAKWVDQQDTGLAVLAEPPVQLERGRESTKATPGIRIRCRACRHEAAVWLVYEAGWELVRHARHWRATATEPPVATPRAIRSTSLLALLGLIVPRPTSHFMA